jgi:hypothetical protein
MSSLITRSIVAVFFYQEGIPRAQKKIKEKSDLELSRLRLKELPSIQNLLFNFTRRRKW